MKAKRHYIGTLLLAALVALPAGAKAKLTLRVNDAVGVPGGQAAIVLRTYASRPIEQGQLCLEATPAPDTGGNGGAATDAPSAEVYSAEGDVTSTFDASLATAVQQFVVNFNSPSGTVNSVDGPLAVIFVDLSPTLVPGQTYNLDLDLANTHLFDANGQPIEIRPRNGVLTIRDPLDPFELGIDAEDAAPGDYARVSVNTRESLPLGSGHVIVSYDPTIATGPPSVGSDPRYGNVDLTLDASVPGIARIDFSSPDDTFNRVPGNLINVFIPTDVSIPVGTQTPVSLDAATFVRTLDGSLLNLTFFTDLLTLAGNFEAPGEAEALTLSKLEDGMLELSWGFTCSDPTGYSVYRGDLALGYASATPIPGLCALEDSKVDVAPVPGISEFFLVVPFLGDDAGGYGGRTPPVGACLSQMMLAGACPEN